jgi:hypothetical protein
MRTSELPRLAPSDFDRAAPLVDMSAERKLMARRVLVDGERQSVIASEYGLTRQAVRDAAVKFLARYEQLRNFSERRPSKKPSRWVTVTLTAPASLVAGWKRAAAAARRELEAQRARRAGAKTKAKASSKRGRGGG